MTTGQLLEKGAIYFDNIVDGMKHYENRMIRMDAQQACERFWNLWELSGYNDIYLDFYYHRLPKEAKERIDEVLSPQERDYIHRMNPQNGEVIFPASEVLLSICARLNDAEILFSTIYITGKHKSTWWGNYNKEYIVFTENK